MRAFSGSFIILLLAFVSVLALDVTFGSELQEQGFISFPTENGGFLTCGMFVMDVSRSIVSSEGPGGLDCMLIRCDSEGNVLWEKEYYSGPWLDLAVAGVPCDDEGFVFAGATTTMEEGQNNWLFRVDPQGQLVWESNPGTDFDDWTYDLAATDDGGYILAGYVDSLSGSGPVPCLLKADGSGNEIWNRQYGGYGSGMAEAVLTTEAGELLVNGYTESGEQGMAVPFLMMTTEDGDVIWFENFQGMAGHCYSLDMSVLGDGNIMMAGYGETGNGDYDIWVGKASTEGEILGEWTFGGSGDDMAFSTCPCPRGIVIAGSTDSAPAERTDLLLMALSPSGEELWWVNHGGRGNEGAEHIGWIPSGGFLVSGYTSSKGEGETDIWVLKVDCEGQLL
ncbi:MAG: hypothetical protein GF388_09375 [Candidatus Aegiribacteria sp.]|nr:hypothetical protein [Candidatus Aegiribacteria sp.]MBD3295267.1 hypothetical protein [Candidatus Fermentibacteria bacterium]